MGNVVQRPRTPEIGAFPRPPRVTVTSSPRPPLTEPPGEASGDPGRRVHARVALALLEALQRQDLPEEVLVDENVSLTLPRRLGLSHVVDAQVRRYREEVRRNRRVPETEVADLIRLAARRPDAPDLFEQVGRSLALPLRSGWRHALPARLLLRHARRRAAAVVARNFGRDLLHLPRGSDRIEEGRDLLYRADPSGAAYRIVTGALSAAVEATGRLPLRVRQLRSRAAGDTDSSWVVELHRPEIVPDGVREPAEEAALPDEGVAGSDSGSGSAARSA